ncbi:UNVERIFIED_CONTAM: hypothetical protein Sradi_0676700 [Sesamum radiatum]|uniref:Uncharacterized protein n=1 Tax=Sesamum radiatum TaxID=300843 RepID=A0AAW2VMS4_SESRA
MGTPVAPNVATHWGDVEQMNWDQRMVHDATGADPSSYSYDVSRLSDRFFDVVCAADQPLYNGRHRAGVLQICGDPRYRPTKDRNPQCKKSPYAVLRYLPLISRLQRSYASPATAKHMTWHACNQTQEGSMCHPSDAETWRHFDKSYPDFAVEPRNVRLALCTDEFAPHRQYGHTYSCRPVILTPYNFPPGICMKPEYMFLTMVIPGPSNPSHCIDVYLEPLIKKMSL